MTFVKNFNVMQKVISHVNYNHLALVPLPNFQHHHNQNITQGFQLF